MCNGQLHQRGIIIINDYASKDKKTKTDKFERRNIPTIGDINTPTRGIN